SVWGSYNRQAPKPAAVPPPVPDPVAAPAPSSLRHDQPAVIQGFKPAQAGSSGNPVPVADKGNVTAAQLQQRVIVTCGPLAQRVNVVPQSDGNLAVEIVVRGTREADEVSSPVLALPDMVSAHAVLKVVVSQ